MRNSAFFVLGFLLLVLGLSMVIKNWDVLVTIFKAFFGILIALIGLVMMFFSGLRK
jgi:hypothetical protein